MAPCEKFFSRKRRRLAKVERLDGKDVLSSVAVAYDGSGRPVSVTDQDGRVRSCGRDALGRIVRETDANGSEVAYAYDAWGRRTSRTIRFADGREAMEECRAYDKYGRLVEIAAFGTSVKWRYDARGRVVRQVVDGTPIDFAYTREGRLAGKWFGGREAPVSVLEYEYAKDGRIVARTANGVRQTYEHDARGQLLAVKENGEDVERYVYDGAGNMLRKTVRGKTTTYTFDGANQLVSSTCDGVMTRYAYDAAGRLVWEGGKTYRYGYLDKVLSMTDGEMTYSYAYHVDGQLARANYGTGGTRSVASEDFYWDGLALVRRGDESFVNEPHVGGGNPVVSSKGVAYFNDLLGTTVGVHEGRGSARKRSVRRYTAAALTAFGEPIPTHGKEDTSAPLPSSVLPLPLFFTGKPQVEGLGHVFLYRNYRASLAKWQTADPLGYPDGWNHLAYCKNTVTRLVDYLGASCTEECNCGVCGCGVWVYPSLLGDGQHYFMGRDGTPIFNPTNEIMNFMEDNFPYAHYFAAVHDSWVDKLVDGWGWPDFLVNIPSMSAAYVFAFLATSYDSFADFINYLQNQLKMPNVQPIWLAYCECKE